MILLHGKNRIINKTLENMTAPALELQAAVFGTEVMVDM